MCNILGALGAIELNEIKLDESDVKVEIPCAAIGIFISTNLLIFVR